MSVRHLRLATALLALLVAFAGTAVLAVGDPIQIDRVTVQIGNVGADGRAPVTAHVEGSAFYGCDRVLHDPVVSRQGSEVTVQIWVERAPPPSPGTVYCQGYALQPVISDINLGSFELGIYTLRVNDYTTTFTVPGGAAGEVIEWPLGPTFAGLFGDGQANTPERIPGRLSVKLVPSATPDDVAPTLALVHGHVVNPELFSPNFRWITVSVPPGTEDLAKLLLERDPHVEFVEFVTPKYPA